MATLRWDGDERGDGVADASPLTSGAVELVDAMRLANWVAEEPELHLRPHVERACRELPLELAEARTSDDGVLDLRLRWTGESPRDGEVRAALFSLVGSFAELATSVRQRRTEQAADGERTFPFEVVTGILAGDSQFAPHGHTVRVRVSAPPTS